MDFLLLRCNGEGDWDAEDGVGDMDCDGDETLVIEVALLAANALKAAAAAATNGICETDETTSSGDLDLGSACEPRQRDRCGGEDFGDDTLKV
ncbi:hypothetical protein KM043_016207 [Ampulex compressa]|nr:hypothetical protein KM043_016207 [Ampulex compressa]